MARWSGAKARSGYYATMREKPNTIGYSPTNHENQLPWHQRATTDFDISCIGIFLMLAPISIPFLILASPMIISSYFKKQRLLTSAENKVRSKFTPRAENVFFPEKKLILSRSGLFELQGDKSLSGAQKIVDRLNNQKHGGLNSWRIPTSKEFSDILWPGKNTCMSIYSSNGDSYSLPKMYNDLGFFNVRAQYYITKNTDSYDNKICASYAHLNDWQAPGFIKNEQVFLWPISDIDGFFEGYDKSGYDHDGYNRNGLGRDGYDQYGVDYYGYDRGGYNQDGFDCYGYGKDGYGKDGYNREGYERVGFHRDGYHRDGYHFDGYNREGVSQFGVKRCKDDNLDADRKKYPTDGYGPDGYGPDGYGPDGYHRDGFNREGRDREGYDRMNYNKLGFDRSGSDRYGYDVDGRDKNGYDKDGYDRFNHDRTVNRRS